MLIGAIALLILGSTQTRPGLALRHSLQSSLKPFGLVTTLDFDETGPLRMFLNPDDAYITPILWANRTWEEKETRWFFRGVRPGDVVVDVGANVGYYTLLASRVVGETGRVYAFEPDPVAFALLERNVRANGLDNVILEQKAVSNEPGSIRLYLAEANKGDHRIYQPEGEQRPHVDVDAVTLDDYFEGVEDTVDYVKVDTQGAEAIIFQGMKRLIERSPSVVLICEFSPRHLAGFGSRSRQLVATFDALGLQIYDFGLGPEDRTITPVTGKQLMKRYPNNTPFFTNLLLVKQRPDLVARIRRAR